jgi:hypothetical protein
MNELVSSVCPARVKWYALVSHYPGMRQEVYAALQEHDAEPLYLLTVLEELLETSPVFIELLSDSDPVIALLPQEYTLYFSAPVDCAFDTLVSHLRLRMNVLFDGMRKGLFHYYHPRVASYFFSRSDMSDTASWLGPFCSVQLLQQTYDSEPRWAEFGDGEPLDDKSTWLLTQSQDQALNAQFEEQDVVTWAEVHGINQINWPYQNATTAFCNDLNIDDPQLITQMRNIVDQYDVNPRLFNTHNKQFSRLNTQEKVEFIEQYLARENQRVD